MNENVLAKLKILAESAKYDVSCSSSGTVRSNKPGMLDESLMDKDEKLFQQLWLTYFKAICIKERMNPRTHRQDMPVRYWRYLTEKLIVCSHT